MSRHAFTEALKALEGDIQAMGDLVGRATVDGVGALVLRDAALAEAVLTREGEVNRLWVGIEQQVQALMALQAPVAGDLREVLAVLAIATDLERSGDHAKSIARGAHERDGTAPPGALVTLERMAEAARLLLRDVLAAFAHRDPSAAAAAARRDADIDDLYAAAQRELLAHMAAHAEGIAEAQRVLNAALRLERIGDHATNIGERVVFLATGEHVELNS